MAQKGSQRPKDCIFMGRYSGFLGAEKRWEIWLKVAFWEFQAIFWV